MNDTDDIKRAVAGNAADFAAWLFSAGKRNGSQWHVGDLTGQSGSSLSIDLSGEFAGCFHDWATGERGDCLALTSAVRGLDFASTKRLLSERYGVRTFPIRKSSEWKRKKPSRPELPVLQRGTHADIQALARNRNLAPDALSIPSERGLLWFYDSSEGRAWLITDSARRNAQARRLDGKPWQWNGKKAWTLGGSCGKWPIGLPESATFAAIAFCEGGPDFLAAFHHAHASGLAERLAPVCLVGATMPISDECLAAFAGKRVRIFVHDDADGLDAAHRWAGQLRHIVSRVDGFTFNDLVRADGKAVKDLCDLASIDVDSWEANRDLVENCMDFAAEGRAE